VVKGSRQLSAFNGTITASVIVASIIVALVSGNYNVCYALFVSTLVFFSVRAKDIVVKLFGIFLTFYLSIALLNISTYRNEISLQTIQMYSFAVLMMLIPLSFVGEGRSYATRMYKLSSLTYRVMAVHILLSWLAVIYIYGRYGIIILNQDARFGIPTGLIYAVRSCQFIPLVIIAGMISAPARKNKWRVIALWSILSIAPTLLIASRATAVLVLVAIAIFVIAADAYGWLQRSRRQPHIPLIVRYAPMFAGITILGIALIVGGFYVRRAGTYQLMDGHVFVSIYFSDNIFSYIVAPLHQGFNETAALTSRIVDYGIRNTFTQTPMIVADFDNMFGRSSTSAAGFFGDRIGRAQAGGLTPGLLGALLLDFREWYWAWFLAIGGVIAYIGDWARRDVRVLLVYAVGLSQFIHLFHRGFVKPEYVFLLMIYTGYVLTFRAVALGRRSAHGR
jgi:hypothetical protein